MLNQVFAFEGPAASVATGGNGGEQREVGEEPGGRKLGSDDALHGGEAHRRGTGAADCGFQREAVRRVRGDFRAAPSGDDPVLGQSGHCGMRAERDDRGERHSFEFRWRGGKQGIFDPPQNLERQGRGRGEAVLAVAAQDVRSAQFRGSAAGYFQLQCGQVRAGKAA